jgi:hypothetical protein
MEAGLVDDRPTALICAPVPVRDCEKPFLVGRQASNEPSISRVAVDEQLDKYDFSRAEVEGGQNL